MRVEVIRGDLTEQRVDAIVNAANSSLLGGGGVDGAVHRTAGPDLLAECQRIRAEQLPSGLPTGEAVATGGYHLPARWVIHTVGPIHDQHPDGGVGLLANCHTSSLTLADELAASSVAFPAISCGVYGWQPADAAPIAVAAVLDYARTHPESGVKSVRFVLFNAEAETAFHAAVTAGR